MSCICSWDDSNLLPAEINTNTLIQESANLYGRNSSVNLNTRIKYKDENTPKPVQVCRKTKILIFGDINTIGDWVPLSPKDDEWSFLKPDPDNKNIYRGLYECSKPDSDGHDYNYAIELTISSDYTKQMKGKDAVVFNVEPLILQKYMKTLPYQPIT